GARLPSRPDLLVACLGRQDHDGEVTGRGVGTQVGEQVDAAPARQHPVHEHDIGRVLGEPGPRLRAVGRRLHDVTLVYEVGGDHHDDVGVVAHDEHPGHSWTPT